MADCAPEPKPGLDRVAGACSKVAALAAVGFRDTRIDGSCPRLEFLLAEGRRDYDKGLFSGICQAAEMLKFRVRVMSAAAMARLEVARCGSDAAEAGRAPKGMMLLDRREIVIQADRRSQVRMQALMHEFGHLADLWSLVLRDPGVARREFCFFGEGEGARGGPGSFAEKWFGRVQRLWWDREMVADAAAAAMAEMHGLGLYPYLTAFLSTAWGAYEDSTAGGPQQAVLALTRELRGQGAGPVGPKPAPQAWLLGALERIMPRAACAAAAGEGLLGHVEFLRGEASAS